MGKPTDKLLPRTAETIPRRLGEKKALRFIAIEEMRKLSRSTTIDDDGILFIVEIETSGIEIGTTNSAESPINHNDFSMMKAWRVHPNSHAVAHQLMHIVKHTVRRERNITMSRHHNLDLYASFNGTA